MPLAQHSNEVHQAQLQLDDGSRLSGDCSVSRELKFQMSGVKLVAGTSASGRVRLQQGMDGRLCLSQQPSLPDLEVVVTAIAEGRISMNVQQPDGAVAELWRDALFQPASAPSRSSDLQGSTDAHTRLLRSVHLSAMQQLEMLMPNAVERIQNELLSQGERTPNKGSKQESLYSSAEGLRKNQQSVCEAMLRKIEAYFHSLVPGADEDEFWQHEITDPEELGLVDLDEFEGQLAFNRTVASAEELYSVELECLTLRLAQLINEDPLRVRGPIHVRQVCRAFQCAIDPLQLPSESAKAVYDHFSRFLVRPLASTYAQLNDTLAESGIQPDLEEDIRSKGSILEKARRQARTTETAKTSPAPEKELPTAQDLMETVAPETDQRPFIDRKETATPAPSAQLTGGPPPKTLTAIPGGNRQSSNIYQSVVDALNYHRQAQGSAHGEVVETDVPLSGTWDGATMPAANTDQAQLADAPAIARSLLSLQHDAEARSALHDGQSIREYLSNHRESFNELRDTSGLTVDSLNQLDMVDNLFGTIRSHIDLAAELQPSLANLQIPLARLALLDQQFFVDSGHAARSVIDGLAKLSNSANFPNRALETRINRVVNDIAENYEHDESVFATALTEIDKLCEQQDRALSRNIERVVRIQEGQEKVQQARMAVNDAINARIRPPAAPRVLLDLVESGWRDLLVLTHVREGPGSDSWADQLKTLDQLNSWLEHRLDSDCDEDLLMQRSLEAETLIELVDQQLSTALPTNVQYQSVLTELRGILSGSLDVVATEITAADIEESHSPQRVRARVEELPRLRRWVRRVEQLEQDSWLTYSGTDGKKRRMQLAWVSPAKDRFIFVNERGQKIADLSAVQLARKLSQGVRPPLPADELPVVDQSMYNTLEDVQETLSFSRNRDSLTRLVNRETFLDQMGRALRHARQKNAQHAVLYLDIDKFSLVNEVFDQVNGDEVLSEFSKLLAQLHGKKISSARIEGDQFAILLLDRDPVLAETFAEKVRSDIEQSSVDIDNEQVTFTVSIGVAPIMEYSASVEDVLNSAQQAMKQAKEQGRNQVQCFEADKTQAAAFYDDKNRSRTDLEHALATDRFVLRAQPIIQVAVSDQQSVGRHYELLLGLSNPDGSISSPEEFIRSAERYGFMNLVDRWVVREAFNWVSELMDAQKEVPSLAINLSGSSVTDDEFLEYLLEQISEFGVGTSRICFEITETGTITNLVKAADFVRAFRNIGCKFSIDDFGTGLASHKYLRELPVDYIKIDGTFITGIHKNRADYAMARSINDLAHFLGQETIAESVENNEIIAKLEEIGVDYLQGWAVAMPQPLAEIAEELSSIIK